MQDDRANFCSRHVIDCLGNVALAARLTEAYNVCLGFADPQSELAALADMHGRFEAVLRSYLAASPSIEFDTQLRLVSVLYRHGGGTGSVALRLDTLAVVKDRVVRTLVGRQDGQTEVGEVLGENALVERILECERAFGVEPSPQATFEKLWFGALNMSKLILELASTARQAEGPDVCSEGALEEVRQFSDSESKQERSPHLGETGVSDLENASFWFA